MSWNPFRKAFSSRKTRQDDIEIDREVQRLHHMQAVAKRLYKDMRKCNEAEAGQHKALGKIVQDLKGSGSCRGEPLKETVDVLSNCVEQLQAHGKEHCSNQDTLLTDPMKRFYNVYRNLEFHTKQREAKLQEMEKQQSKLEKMQASQSVQPGKLEVTQRKLSSAKSEYERVHQRLLQELPVLYEGRVGFFEPCVDAINQSELLYHQQCASTLSEALVKLPNYSSSSDLDSHQRTHELINDIRTLSIVGESHVRPT